MPLEDIQRDRLGKLERYEAAGRDPYPASVRRTFLIGEALEKFSLLSKAKKNISLVGRLRAWREHGGATFGDLRDASGLIQLYFSRDELGKDYDFALESVDIGDFLEIAGQAFKTKRGEPTLKVSAWRIISKSLLPLPEKWHGLKDVEERYRKRHLDILFNPTIKEIFLKRGAIIKATHDFFAQRGYVEVDTPILQPLYGGGLARPFRTHHNALDIDLYLRISDELYLKRLMVAGFERVYEICKDFRNEGIDRHHNPEFTLLEAMTAYQDYRFTMDLVEEYYELVVKKVNGSLQVKYGDTVLDFRRPWKRFAMVDLVKDKTGFDFDKTDGVVESKRQARKLGIPVEKIARQLSVGELVNLIFEEKVQPGLSQPTIVYDYPVETSPLAKKSAKDSRLVERFEHFILGQEHGNHYTELNDPLDLAQRFVAEAKKKKAGFEEAHQTDTEFLEAVEYGMPPATGLGISIDRLIMLLTDTKNIREVVLFPTLRPK